MIVTSFELRTKLRDCLEAVQTEDVIITKYGKFAALLTSRLPEPQGTENKTAPPLNEALPSPDEAPIPTTEALDPSLDTDELPFSLEEPLEAEDLSVLDEAPILPDEALDASLDTDELPFSLNEPTEAEDEPARDEAFEDEYLSTLDASLEEDEPPFSMDEPLENEDLPFRDEALETETCA